MNDRVLYSASIAFGALALLLLIANVCLINGNGNLQSTLGQHQALINNSPAMNQVNQYLVQSLAQASINDEDKEARELLASQGITIKPKADKGVAAVQTDNKDKKK